MGADEVDEAAGGGGDEVDGAFGEAVLLRGVVHAAVDGDAAKAGVAAQLVGVLDDLDDELARGGEDERGGAGGLRRALRLALEHPVDDGDEERGGLAGAGLRLAGDVESLHRLHQGGGLDGGAVLEAGVVDGVEDFLGQVEVLEALLVLLGLDDEDGGVPGFGGDGRGGGSGSGLLAGRAAAVGVVAGAWLASRGARGVVGGAVAARGGSRGLGGARGVGGGSAAAFVPTG